MACSGYDFELIFMSWLVFPKISTSVSANALLPFICHINYQDNARLWIYIYSNATGKGKCDFK